AACNAGCTGTACVSHDAAGNCVDAKGGISQFCCANNTALPCFPTSPASAAAGLGKISRTGKPVVPGDTTGGTFAGTFCIAHTDPPLHHPAPRPPGPGAAAPAAPRGGQPQVPAAHKPPGPCPTRGGPGNRGPAVVVSARRSGSVVPDVTPLALQSGGLLR